MARNLSGAGAVLLVGGLLAIGCSHAWDVLEPLGGSTGTGGASPSSTSGVGGAGGGSGGAPAGSVTSGGPTTDVSSTSAVSSTAESSSSGGPVILTAYYGASLGACNSVQNLDPDACEDQAGLGIMYADLKTDSNATVYAFIRFDLDGTFAGKTVDKVTLRLTSANTPQSESDSSGDIWEVTPFTKASLAMGHPDGVGDKPLASSYGPIVVSKDYYWDLPKDLVAPGAPVFMVIDQLSEDSVDYWNDHGDVPPLLIVEYH